MRLQPLRLKGPLGVSDRRWFRLCVDVDDLGHPIGSSLEVHAGDDVLRVTALEAPGPFDTPADVLAVALELSKRYWRLTLFP